MKKMISLYNEDSYDDNNYASYETDDYFDEQIELDESSEENDIEDNDISEECCTALDDDLDDLYNKQVTVEKGEASRQRYTKLAEIARTGTVEEVKKAQEEACLYMKGLVREFIKRSFHTYVEKDPGYAKDLEQEAYYNIIKYLPYYDPQKGLPSTFFYTNILSAMVSSTNQMKHSISSADAALQRKIKRIKEEYKKLGRIPEIGDYMVETGETMSKIRSVLRMMEIDKNTHLEAIEEANQLIAGDPTVNSMYDTPENIVMRKIMCENVIKRMKQLFPVDEVNIFLRNAMYEESIPSIAKSSGGKIDDDKIRRTIEKIGHAIAYDSEIRGLCASFLKKDNMDGVCVTILPVSGQSDNMEELEQILL